MTVGARKSITLFVAEDHVVISDLLCSYLSGLPEYKVIGRAADGRTALEECLKLKPQILILDIDLPHLNGIQIAQKIKAEEPGINVLMFSSHYNSATLRQCMEAGAKGIIEKPAPLTTFVQGLEAIAQGRSFFGPAIVELMQRAFTDPIATQTPDTLTSREREVLQLIAEGRSNKEVASQLGITLKTAENHRAHIMRKLNARNGADLTREAYRLGIIRSQQTPGSQG